jgi:hypothetical protein
MMVLVDLCSAADAKRDLHRVNGDGEILPRRFVIEVPDDGVQTLRWSDVMAAYLVGKLDL